MTSVFLNLNPRNFLLISTLISIVVTIQSLSHVWLFETPWIAASRDSLFSISWSLLPLTSIEIVMPSNHLILCHPLLFLPSVFPSIRVFSNESALCIRWPKYWSFSFSLSPSNENSGLISFRIDWCDLQGTLKNLLKHHISKASIRQHLAFFMVQLSHLHRTTAKNHSFGYMYLCQQSDVSAFYIAVIRPRWLWLEHWQLSHLSFKNSWNINLSFQ